jgi:hypothetical protein
MKTCKGECGKTKPLSEFSKAKAHKDGLQNWCKSCMKKKGKQWRENNPEYDKQYIQSHKDGRYYVYLLPEVNYVGVTERPYYRMTRHKFDNNISTSSSYEILHSFDNRDHALVVEDYYHELGWNGKYGEPNTNLLKC